MAEGWTSSVLCRYHVNGACREGSRCPFSHDRQNGQLSNVCRYYLRGCCAYGDRCRYDHIKPQTVGQNAKNEHRVASGSSNHSSTPSASSPNSASVGKSSVTHLHHHHKAQQQPLGTPFSSKLIPKLTPIISTSAATPSRMTVLHKQGQSSDSGLGDEIIGPFKINKMEWANAPEFIPGGPKSYAAAVTPSAHPIGLSVNDVVEMPDCGLCPYAMVSECPFGENCEYIHGDVCELCGYPCLHPTDESLRRKHTQDCMKEHERDMELSFAVARSKDKMCGICMDVIMEKLPPNERRFGILPNCCHVFCLSCIRKWRGAKQFDNKLVRACPECRLPSDFVTPSKYWVDAKEDKDKLIADYRKALSTKPCKYFKQGRGECPFAGNCFYLHAYPDGRKADLPPPRPRKRHNADGEFNLMQSVILWDFLEERDSRWLFQFDLEDMLEFFSDSEDDSDWSDYDLWD